MPETVEPILTTLLDNVGVVLVRSREPNQVLMRGQPHRPRPLNRAATPDAGLARQCGGRPALPSESPSRHSTLIALGRSHGPTGLPHRKRRVLCDVRAGISAPMPVHHPPRLRHWSARAPAEAVRQPDCRKPAAPAPTDERLPPPWPPGRRPSRQITAG
jgi:hypothetical protein